LNNNLLPNAERSKKVRAAAGVWGLAPRLHAVAAHRAGPVTKNPYLQRMKITKKITKENCKRNSNWEKSEINYKKMP